MVRGASCSGGYIWTFAKGRPNANESPEQAALRETLEETGLVAEIVRAIPGSFKGGTSATTYYLTRPVGTGQKPDKETAEARWVAADEAPALIQRTRNAVGRERDLKVLAAALKLWAEGGTTETPPRSRG
jgi:8-oxo-dGTP diphosphatase